MSNHDPYSDSSEPFGWLRLQSLLGHGSRHCLWNHLTQNRSAGLGRIDE
jgi:hypothetical protein